MEFHEKLQELRKKKGLTQEELAQSLYVSRAAVSKWESGRGYPNIDSLKTVANFYAVSIDELLSGEEMLTLAEEDNRQKQNGLQGLVFGLIDLSVLAFLFLPLFGQRTGESVQAVTLLALSGISVYLRILYFGAVATMVILGVILLLFQKLQSDFWKNRGYMVSLLATGVFALLCIVSSQPYAATFLFLLFTIKGLLIVRNP